MRAVENSLDLGWTILFSHNKFKASLIQLLKVVVINSLNSSHFVAVKVYNNSSKNFHLERRNQRKLFFYSSSMTTLLDIWKRKELCWIISDLNIYWVTLITILTLDHYQKSKMNMLLHSIWKWIPNCFNIFTSILGFRCSILWSKYTSLPKSMASLLKPFLIVAKIV